jgi:hypothetical protein
MPAARFMSKDIKIDVRRAHVDIERFMQKSRCLHHVCVFVIAIVLHLEGKENTRDPSLNLPRKVVVVISWNCDTCLPSLPYLEALHDCMRNPVVDIITIAEVLGNMIHALAGRVASRQTKAAP